jgi:hypothetical protein
MKAVLVISFLMVCANILLAQAPKVPDIQPIIKTNNDIHKDFLLHFPDFKVISTHHKEYTIDAQTLKGLKQEWVTSYKILQDSLSKSKYGKAGVKGVTLITLDDDDHPEAYVFLKKGLRVLK